MLGHFLYDIARFSLRHFHVYQITTFAAMLDYLVVGLGLAGISFCEHLEKENKSFKVISDDSQTSSMVAAGLYNPIVLKRFTLAWKANEQLNVAIPFYSALEQKLGVQLDYKVQVLRRFTSIREQNDWFSASDKEGVGAFLSREILTNKNESLDAPYGFGRVLHTGRIDTRKLLSSYSNYLDKSNRLIRKTFDFESLNIFENGVEYKTIKARQVVFAEGFGLRKNPYFKYLPLNGTKGELVTIKSVELKVQNVIKGPIFLIPLGDDRYLTGATYEQKDKTNVPTEKAKLQLLKKLESFLKCDYKVVDHHAGIRPTVSDRRPLVGRHPVHKNVYLLNGFGSRGVIIAPYASRQLFEFIEYQSPIDTDMNIDRFDIV